MKKRVFALLLSVALVIGMFPLMSFDAVAYAEDGTTGDEVWIQSFKAITDDGVYVEVHGGEVDENEYQYQYDMEQVSFEVTFTDGTVETYDYESYSSGSGIQPIGDYDESNTDEEASGVQYSYPELDVPEGGFASGYISAGFRIAAYDNSTGEESYIYSDNQVMIECWNFSDDIDYEVEIAFEGSISGAVEGATIEDLDYHVPGNKITVTDSTINKSTSPNLKSSSVYEYVCISATDSDNETTNYFYQDGDINGYTLYERYIWLECEDSGSLSVGDHTVYLCTSYSDAADNTITARSEPITVHVSEAPVVDPNNVDISDGYSTTDYHISGTKDEMTLTLSGESIWLRGHELERILKQDYNNVYKFENIKHIVVSDGVVEIKENGLKDYTGVTDVTLPDSLEKISGYAFEGCYSLQDIDLPDSLTYIGEYAFHNCVSLMKVSIPDAVTYVGTGAFVMSGDALGIDFPASISEIDTYRALYDTTCDEADQFGESMQKAKEIINGLELDEKTEYEKAEAVYKWIADNITLDSNAGNSDETSFYEMLFSGKASSYGVGKLTSLLMNFAGIRCVDIDSDAAKWNIVKIGDQYYEIECVQDLGREPLEYNRFLRSKDYMDDLASEYDVIDEKYCSTEYDLADQPMYTQAFYDTHPIAPRYTTNKFRYIVVDGNAWIEGYSTKKIDDWSLTIPAEIDGYPVKKICSEAFVEMEYLDTLVISEGIETAGGQAFYDGAQNTKKVTIPVSLTNIAPSAFDGLYTEESTVIYKGTCAQYEELAIKSNCDPLRLSNKIKCSDGNYSYPWKIDNCKVSLGKKKYTYTGSVIKPAVTVKYDGTALKEGTDYILDYDKFKFTGTGEVFVEGTGKFAGEKTLWYTVIPKATKLKKVAAGKKKLTAYWTKQTEKVKGYQIQIATNSKFTKNVKKYKVSKKSTVKYVIKGLTSKKTYYVRVRTYAIDEYYGDGYVYSAWSNVKKIKVK